MRDLHGYDHVENSGEGEQGFVGEAWSNEIRREKRQ